MNTQISNNDGAQSVASLPPRTGSDAQLMISRDLVEIRDCGGTVIERKIVERVCGVVWTERRSYAACGQQSKNMNEANNQARLLEQLVALASRAAYVCAHDYEAHKPVGTRLLAIADLKAEYDRTAQLLKEIQESGGRAPDATKTAEDKHVGISDWLGQSETWFSYDPCDGFETHDTETAARERAEKALQYEKDEAAGEGWNEEVTQICWGKVAQKVEETSRKDRPPDSELDCGVDKDGTIWGEFDVILDYDLCPNEKS